MSETRAQPQPPRSLAELVERAKRMNVLSRPAFLAYFAETVLQLADDAARAAGAKDAAPTADAIERLERFRGGHKARSCSIDVDDGYGATCWSVVLRCEGGRNVDVTEADLMREAGGSADWPGLAAVIRRAIDKAEAGLAAPPAPAAPAPRQEAP